MPEPYATPRQHVSHLEGQLLVMTDVHTKIRLTILALYVYQFRQPLIADKDQSIPESREIPNIDVTLALITIQTLRFSHAFSTERLLDEFAVYFFGLDAERLYHALRRIDPDDPTDATSLKYGHLYPDSEFPSAPAISRPDHFYDPWHLFSDGDMLSNNNDPRWIYLFKVLKVWNRLYSKIQGVNRADQEMRMRWMERFLDDSTWMHTDSIRRQAQRDRGNPWGPPQHSFLLLSGGLDDEVDELDIRRTIWPLPHKRANPDEKESMISSKIQKELQEEWKDQKADGALVRAIPFALTFFLSPAEAVNQAWSAVRFTNPSQEVQDAVELFVFILCEIMYTMSDIGRVNKKEPYSKADLLYTVATYPFRSARMCRYFYGGPQQRVYGLDYQCRLIHSPLITLKTDRLLHAFILGNPSDTQLSGSAAGTLFIVLWALFQTDTMDAGKNLLDSVRTRYPDLITRNAYSIYGALTACWYGEAAPVLYLSAKGLEDPTNYVPTKSPFIDYVNYHQPDQQFRVAFPRESIDGPTRQHVSALQELYEKTEAYWYAEWGVAVYELCFKYHPYLGLSRIQSERERMHGWYRRVLYNGQQEDDPDRPKKRAHIDNCPSDPDNWPASKRRKTSPSQGYVTPNRDVEEDDEAQLVKGKFGGKSLGAVLQVMSDAGDDESDTYLRGYTLEEESSIGEMEKLVGQVEGKTVEASQAEGDTRKHQSLDMSQQSQLGGKSLGLIKWRNTIQHQTSNEPHHPALQYGEKRSLSQTAAAADTESDPKRRKTSAPQDESTQPPSSSGPQQPRVQYGGKTVTAIQVSLEKNPSTQDISQAQDDITQRQPSDEPEESSIQQGGKFLDPTLQQAPSVVSSSSSGSANSELRDGGAAKYYAHLKHQLIVAGKVGKTSLEGKKKPSPATTNPASSDSATIPDSPTSTIPDDGARRQRRGGGSSYEFELHVPDMPVENDSFVTMNSSAPGSLDYRPYFAGRRKSELDQFFRPAVGRYPPPRPGEENIDRWGWAAHGGDFEKWSKRVLKNLGRDKNDSSFFQKKRKRSDEPNTPDDLSPRSVPQGGIKVPSPTSSRKRKRGEKVQIDPPRPIGRLAAHLAEKLKRAAEANAPGQAADQQPDFSGLQATSADALERLLTAVKFRAPAQPITIGSAISTVQSNTQNQRQLNTQTQGQLLPPVEIFDSRIGPRLKDIEFQARSQPEPRPRGSASSSIQVELTPGSHPGIPTAPTVSPITPHANPIVTTVSIGTAEAGNAPNPIEGDKVVHSMFEGNSAFSRLLPPPPLGEQRALYTTLPREALIGHFQDITNRLETPNRENIRRPSRERMEGGTKTRETGAGNVEKIQKRNGKEKPDEQEVATMKETAKQGRRKKIKQDNGNNGGGGGQGAERNIQPKELTVEEILAEHQRMMAVPTGDISEDSDDGWMSVLDRAGYDNNRY